MSGISEEAVEAQDIATQLKNRTRKKYNIRMAYSKDFKKLVLKYRRNGHTVKDTCEFSGIAPSTFYEWEKEERLGFPAKEKRSYEKKIRKEELKKAVEEKPDSYLRELAKPFNCTPQAVQKALNAIEITRKKDLYIFRKIRGKASGVFRGIDKTSEEQRVYVDEIGCNEYYQREYGCDLRGVKVEDVCRGRKFARTNIIAAKCNGEIWSPKTYNHTTNSRFFADRFEFDLLSVVPPGYTILMDNASFHPKKDLKRIADRYGVKLLFLPAYSPDFNMIEKFWANLKQRLREHIVGFTSLQIAITQY